MYKVGDRVIVMRYNPVSLGTIMYVKEYDIRKEFYVIELDNGEIGYYKEDEVFLDKKGE